MTPPRPDPLNGPPASATPGHRHALLREPGLVLRRAFAWDLSGAAVSPIELDRLVRRGVAQDTLQRYLVWRRSLLLAVVLPLVFSASLQTLNELEDLEALNWLGDAVVCLDLLAAYLLPATALAAGLLWSRPRLSYRLLLAGWAVGFAVPILTALLPLRWLLVIPTEYGEFVTRAARVGTDVVAGVLYYFALMPTVLSLIPGGLRACVRIKSLLPGSTLPGWFLVAGAPLYVLLVLVLFVAVNQVIGNLLLLAGVALLLSAPLIYLARAPLFVRPLPAAGRAALSRVQWAYLGCTFLGAALLVAYLLTKKLGPLHLVGTDP
ncbi:MAG TPA: hypothetical protein VFE78_33520, partial [Gemmataceae bacterium]|nr:hypothetical protein [Gemmataceae bacterium]